MSDPFDAAVEAFHDAPGNTSDGVRAACAAYLAALPRREPSDAEVERAYGVFWINIPSGQADEAACHRAMRAALATLPALPTPDCGRHWKHVKRGTTYAEIGRAELQASQDVIEGVTLVVYRGADGKLWARQEDEFEDGRFEKVQPGAAS